MLNLIILEWVGAAASVIGAGITAFYIKKISIAWLLWIFSSLMFVLLFLSTSQFGFLAAAIFGLIVNTIGFFQWRGGAGFSTGIRIIFWYTGLLFVFLGFLTFLYTLFFELFPAIEWFIAFFGIAGTIILASKSKHHQLCWVFWCISNSTFAYVSFVYTEQYGVFVQQAAFMFVNTIGVYNSRKYFLSLIKN